jgi:hypothetical protein
MYEWFSARVASSLLNRPPSSVDPSVVAQEHRRSPHAESTRRHRTNDDRLFELDME